MRRRQVQFESPSDMQREINRALRDAAKVMFLFLAGLSLVAYLAYREAKEGILHKHMVKFDKTVDNLMK